MNTVTLPLPPKTRLKKRYDDHVDSLERLVHELQRRLRSVLANADLRATIKYRVKSFDSYYRKLIRLSRTLAPGENEVELFDLVGVRVVCPFLQDVAQAEGALRAAFTVREIDRKGADFSIREFGYDSIHCLLQVPQDLLESFHLGQPFDCEVQLRTILQDAWAEVEHELVYKSEFTPFDEPLQRKLAALNANLSLSDITFQEIREYQSRLTHEIKTRRTAFWQTISNATGDSESDLFNGHESEPVTFGVSADLATLDEDTGDQRWETTPNLDALLLSALQAHNAGNHQEAIQTYTTIIDASPKPFVRAVVYIHRGMACFASGSYREALKDFTGALDLDTDNCRALFYRGTVYRILGDMDRAETDLKRCLKIDPYRVDCLYQCSSMYLSLGRLNEADTDCERALELEPDMASLRQLQKSIAERRAYQEQ